MKAVGVVLLTFAISVVLCLVFGFVFRILWGWFIAPKFGLPTLTLGEAIGIGIVVSFATGQRIPSDESLWESVGLDAAYFMAVALFALTFGAIVHGAIS